MKLFDLFSGIGGFRLGLRKHGFECVGWSEINKFSRRSYKAIFDTEGEWTKNDAREIRTEELPNFDILSAGFPCQSFSVAGDGRGLQDTRGTLFFEIARIARDKLPKILLMENVKGLLNHSNGETFKTILKTLHEIGYSSQWQVLNSRDFSYEGKPIPQSRERLFIISHLRGQPRPEIFPFRRKVEGDAREISAGKGQTYPIDANYYKGISPNFIGTSRRTQVYQDGRVRQLTPLECWRLQGFPDWAYERAKKVNSDYRLYQQAGNAVTVNVVEAIGKRLRQEVRW